MSIIDGKRYAALLRHRVKSRVTALLAKGIIPHLAVILVGNNPASALYIKRKREAAEEVGIATSLYHLEEHRDAVIPLLHRLNDDPTVHGILVQLPLPKPINKLAVLNTIDPRKDVDGFNALNVGKLCLQDDCFIPCTARGILMLLEDTLGKLAGLKALVIGRSNIVGKPTAELLLQANCTVTIGHSYSVNLLQECRRSDIVVVAAGVPKLIDASWIKSGACVIDVGIHHLPDGNGICGDVDFSEVVKVAGHISPVPGGVGPMTVACLLANTVRAAELLSSHSHFDDIFAPF